MNNKDLLKAVGSIDEKFIQEAEGNERIEVNGKIGKKTPQQRRGGFKKGIKWTGVIAAVLALAIILPNAVRGLAPKSESADPGYYYEPSDYGDYEGAVQSSKKNGSSGVQKPGSSIGTVNYAYNEVPHAADDASPSEGNNSAAYENYKNVKLIYRADITAQTTEFSKADEALRALTDTLGGYFESQSISNGTYYNGEYLKKASYTVRIPAGQYSAFIASVGEDITVTKLNQDVQDVGLEYYETEQRIETLQIKLDRLQSLLAAASDMSDIITLEDAISDCEYELTRYQQSKNKYDSLISYSSITLSLTEVARPGSGIENREGFFKKLGRYFSEGMENAGENVASVFYWISYNLVGIAIFIVIILLLRKFRPFTKLYRRIRKTE